MGVIKDCSDSLRLVAEEFEKSLIELPQLKNAVELSTQMSLTGLHSTAAIMKRFKPEDK